MWDYSGVKIRGFFPYLSGSRLRLQYLPFPNFKSVFTYAHNSKRDPNGNMMGSESSFFAESTIISEGNWCPFLQPRWIRQTSSFPPPSLSFALKCIDPTSCFLRGSILSLSVCPPFWTERKGSWENSEAGSLAGLESGLVISIVLIEPICSVLVDKLALKKQIFQTYILNFEV